jgi:hypothetical protein
MICSIKGVSDIVWIREEERGYESARGAGKGFSYCIYWTLMVFAKISYADTTVQNMRCDSW